MDSFNANFKKQRESVTNQIIHETKNRNHKLDTEELINLRKLFTDNPIIGVILILIIA